MHRLTRCLSCARRAVAAPLHGLEGLEEFVPLGPVDARHDESPDGRTFTPISAAQQLFEEEAWEEAYKLDRYLKMSHMWDDIHKPSSAAGRAHARIVQRWADMSDEQRQP